MTKETKVGLLVGVGVILLFGIIVSDYLSVAQQQDPADLPDFGRRAAEAIDPEPSHTPLRDVHRGMTPRNAVPLPEETPRNAGNVLPETDRSSTTDQRPLVRAFEVRSQQSTAPRDHANTTPNAVPLNSASANAPASIEDQIIIHDTPSLTFDANPRPELPNNIATPRTEAEPLVHYVKKSETLYEIAQRYYGNGDYYHSIIEANTGRVQPNGHVREGVRLVIPNKAGLAGRGTSVATQNQRSTLAQRNAATPDTIVVQEGETLTTLAKRYLGSESKWEAIYNANRHQVSSPNVIAPGMRLKLPSNAARTTQQRTTRAASYTVRTGDTLSTVAHRLLGDSSRWDEIYKVNRDVIKNPDALVVGMELQLPRR